MDKIKLPDIWVPFESMTANALKSVKDKMSNLIAYLSGIAPIASLGKIYDALASGAANAYSFVTDKFSQLFSYLSAIKWPESLGNLWSIITSGASSMFQTVTNALNWLIDKVNWFIDKLNKIKLPSWLPMVGGKGINIEMMERIEAPAAAPTAVAVPGHAEGGVFDVPHLAMVAEKPEAIIPLDRLLNAIKEKPSAIPSSTISYSPTFTINVTAQNATEIGAEVERAAKRAQEEFEARLKAFLAQQRRLSYA